MSRKLPRELENPIDTIMYNISGELAPTFKKLHFTPNILTIISFMCGLLSIYFYTIEKYVFSAIMFALASLFDCCDGDFARRYNMTSKFGDILDHTTDSIIIILLIVVFCMKYRTAPGIIKYVPLLWIPVALLTYMHMGCESSYHTKKTGKKEVFHFIEYLCPTGNITKVSKLMKYTRYIGYGTKQLFVIFLILLSATF